MVNKVKFRHFRNLEMNAFGYISGNSNLGGYTLAYTECCDGYLLGLAICQDCDNFSKETGRKIAASKMVYPVSASVLEQILFCQDAIDLEYDTQAERVVRFFKHYYKKEK